MQASLIRAFARRMRQGQPNIARHIIDTRFEPPVLELKAVCDVVQANAARHVLQRISNFVS